MLKFAHNEPAALAGKALVIPDLHIGYEYELWKSGINVPSQTDKMKARILELLKRGKAKSIVVLGDIKHEIPRATRQEEREIPEFFNDLANHAFVHIIKGNHDGAIEKLIEGIPNTHIYSSSGFALGEFAFAHGNSWPSESCLKAKILITGHVHPMFEFHDSFGYRRTEPCWLRGQVDKKKVAEHYKVQLKDVKLEEVVVSPTFNKMQGGVAVNGPENIFTGPVMSKILVKKSAEAFLLDGTSLGKI
jgi:uncharacterized protein